jgi:hypothetical protein
MGHLVVDNDHGRCSIGYRWLSSSSGWSRTTSLPLSTKVSVVVLKPWLVVNKGFVVVYQHRLVAHHEFAVVYEGMGCCPQAAIGCSQGVCHCLPGQASS